MCSVRNFKHFVDFQAMLEQLDYISHLANVLQRCNTHRAYASYHLLLQDRVNKLVGGALLKPTCAW
jgi:hypothetical protein